MAAKVEGVASLYNIKRTVRAGRTMRPASIPDADMGSALERLGAARGTLGPHLEIVLVRLPVRADVI